MKKYIILMAIAIVAILSSCSNDDITIKRAITFKVNPATVVNSLYENNNGDLTSLGNGSKLHVSLFIYDQNGILVNKISEDYDAYTKMMTKDLNLPAGQYTAVATSNVTSSVDFWTFSGTDLLSEFKITDNGYIGGKNKILGLTIRKFTIGENTETINIDIENAGAVAFVRFYHWNKYSIIQTYSLMGKQACDYVSFDNLGNIDYSTRSESTFKFYKIKFDYNSEYSGASGYFFTFPIKNASFRFYAESNDGEFYTMGNEFVDDVELGGSYYFLYDFDDDEAYWYDMTNDNSRGVSLNPFEKYNNNDLVVYDFEGKTISIK